MPLRSNSSISGIKQIVSTSNSSMSTNSLINPNVNTHNNYIDKPDSNTNTTIFTKYMIHKY